MNARRWCALAALLWLVVQPSAARAQTATLSGAVTGDSLGAPIGGAEVMLPALHRSVTTSERGAFEIRDLPSGTYLLTVRRVGFVPWEDSVTLTADQAVTRTIVLRAQAAVLDSVRVTGSSPTYISPLLRGFEERRHQGFGHFVTEDELRKQEGHSLGSVIDRYVPGLQHVYEGPAIYIASGRKMGSAGPVFLHRSEQREMCWVSVYIDGVLIYDASRTDPSVKPPDFSHMSTDTFAGVEFYAGGATMPPQFNATSSGCGTLLLWTRER
jgi:hypothetical protein